MGPAFYWNAVGFIDTIANGRIVDDTDTREVWVYNGQVFCVRAVGELSARVSEKSVLEDAPSSIQPIDEWICILLHGSGEDDKRVPPRNSPEEEIHKGTLVDVIQCAMAAENNLDHMAGALVSVKGAEAEEASAAAT